MRITHTSTVTAAPGDALTIADLRDLVARSAVPDDARVTPVLRELGSQRDPVTVLGGLTVTWETEA